MSDRQLERAQRSIGRALYRALAGEDKQMAIKARELGYQVSRLIIGALRMNKLHDKDNAAFDKPLEAMVQSLHDLHDMLGTVLLVCVEDQVHVNDLRIRFAGDAAESGRLLGQELGRHGVGGLAFTGVPVVGQLRAFVSCFAAAPEGPDPRITLATRLRAAGVDNIELFGSFRFRMTGEEQGEAQVPAVGAQRVNRLAHHNIELVWDHLAAGRNPNPLALRRIVTSILDVGLGAEGLWEEGPGISPHSSHCRRVCQLCLVIGRGIGLAEGPLQDLGLAALFHDMGYAAREGESDGNPGYAPPFERHSAAGARLLLRQKGFGEAKVLRALSTLEHHRAPDDPRGRPTLFARIIRIAEDYDNLVFRSGCASPVEALGRIVAGARRHYDPLLVQVLVNALGAWPVGTFLQLADGRVVRTVGLVRSPGTFGKPLARVVTLADGTLPDEEELIDLAEEGVIEGLA